MSTPLKVTRTDGAFGYACRYCIAMRGLKASEIDALPKDEAGAHREAKA